MRHDIKRISTPPGSYWALAGLVMIIAVATVFLMTLRWF
jgi:hypothetical protein